MNSLKLMIAILKFKKTKKEQLVLLFAESFQSLILSQWNVLSVDLVLGIMRISILLLKVWKKLVKTSYDHCLKCKIKKTMQEQLLR